MSPLAAPRDEALGVQLTQALAHRRHPGVRELRQLTHAVRTADREALEQPKPLGIAHRSEDRRSTGDDLVPHRMMMEAG